MVIEVNAKMKLYFGVNTFKWVSPEKELDHGISHLSEYFPYNSGIQSQYCTKNIVKLEACQL